MFGFGKKKADKKKEELIKIKQREKLKEKVGRDYDLSNATDEQLDELWNIYQWPLDIVLLRLPGFLEKINAKPLHAEKYKDYYFPSIEKFVNLEKTDKEYYDFRKKHDPIGSFAMDDKTFKLLLRTPIKTKEDFEDRVSLDMRKEYDMFVRPYLWSHKRVGSTYRDGECYIGRINLPELGYSDEDADAVNEIEKFKNEPTAYIDAIIKNGLVKYQVFWICSGRIAMSFFDVEHIYNYLLCNNHSDVNTRKCFIEDIVKLNEYLENIIIERINQKTDEELIEYLKDYYSGDRVLGQNAKVYSILDDEECNAKLKEVICKYISEDKIDIAKKTTRATSIDVFDVENYSYKRTS